jgi:transcriptional regulator with XRE-family HTH domain
MNTTTPSEDSNDNRPIPARIGEVIRQTRTRAALTQEVLAEKSGVDVRTVQRIEAGRSATRLPTLGWIAGALGTTPAALLEEAGSRIATRGEGASPLDDAEFWAKHRQRDESLLVEIIDIRGLERALRNRVLGYVTSRTTPAHESEQDPSERQHDQKDFIMSLLMHSPVDAATQSGLAMLRSLEKALSAVRAKGNAVFAGEAHYCDLVVAVVEDNKDNRSFVVENGIRYYRADIGPDPEEPWDLPDSEP